MFKKRQEKGLDDIIANFNNMWKELNERIAIMKEIYPEAETNQYLGPIRLAQFKEILAYWEGKEETWFQMSLEVNKKYHNFTTMSRKEKKLKLTLSMIGKSISLLKMYINNTTEILHDNLVM